MSDYGMGAGVSRWLQAAAALFLLQELQALGVIDRLAYGEWDGKSGDKITQAMNVLFIAASAAMLLCGLRNFQQVRSGAALWLSAAGLLLVSALWSINPSFTIREAILFATLVIGCVGLATNFGPDGFLSLVARCCLGIALGSLALYSVAPGLALGSSGDFRGLLSQKNVLGQAMVVGVLAYLHCLRVGKGTRLANVLGLVAISAVALKAQSATSCLTIATLCALEIGVAMFRKGGAAKALAMMGLVAGVPALAVAFAAPDALLEMIGKEPTLTGRTDIWEFVTQRILERPLLGWGYYAFWTTSNPHAVELSSIVHWVVPQAHNGLLEILLDVGVVGAVAFIALWTQGMLLAIRCFRVGQPALALSTLLATIAIILIGVSEMVLISPLEATTPVFLTLCLMCERRLRESRFEAQRQAWLRATDADRRVTS